MCVLRCSACVVPQGGVEIRTNPFPAPTTIAIWRREDAVRVSVSMSCAAINRGVEGIVVDMGGLWASSMHHRPASLRLRHGRETQPQADGNIVTTTF